MVLGTIRVGTYAIFRTVRNKIKLSLEIGKCNIKQKKINRFAHN